MSGSRETDSLLRFECVSVRYPHTPPDAAPALRDFSAELLRGQVLALVGESGSGKSTAGFAAGGLLPSDTSVEGTVFLDGTRIPVADPAAFKPFRGRRIGFVFQEPSSALHPSMRILSQVAEAFSPPLSKQQRNGRVSALLRSVRLDPDRRLLRAYPHHLSGGMQQRVVLAMALANEPDVLIADEPTTALDPTLRRGILDLLRSQATNAGRAVLLITHDFGVVAHYADRVAVLLQGRLVETGDCREILERPVHPYTRSLIAAARGPTTV